MTLQEALDQQVLEITELDESGSVPELKVTNTAAQYVLLLDGEELMGAKQNRVLNTTILIKPNSETVIPVSCTEQMVITYHNRFKQHQAHLQQLANQHRLLLLHCATTDDPLIRLQQGLGKRRKN